MVEYNTTNIFQIACILRDKYRDFNHNNKKNPLNELFYILLSIRTTEKIAVDVYRIFKNYYPRNQLLMDASSGEITKVIEKGGFENKRAIMIKRIIEILVEKFKKPTLAPLKKLTDRECERFLVSLPGIGKKATRCIMMYSFNRKVFPVDSNCWRIGKRLGLVDWKKSDEVYNEKDMDLLQDKIPPEIRYSLHVNIVSLGRRICTAINPKCEECPIFKFCKTGHKFLKKN